MVVLQIVIVDLVAGDFKDDAPVSGNRNAPCPGPVADKLLGVPAGRALQPLDGFDAQQGGKDAPDPAQERPDAPFVVILDKAFSPLCRRLRILMPSCVRFSRTFVIKPACVATSNGGLCGAYGAVLAPKSLDRMHVADATVELKA